MNSMKKLTYLLKIARTRSPTKNACIYLFISELRGGWGGG